MNVVCIVVARWDIHCTSFVPIVPCWCAIAADVTVTTVQATTLVYVVVLSPGFTSCAALPILTPASQAKAFLTVLVRLRDNHIAPTYNAIQVMDLVGVCNYTYFLVSFVFSCEMKRIRRKSFILPVIPLKKTSLCSPLLPYSKLLKNGHRPWQEWCIQHHKHFARIIWSLFDWFKLTPHTKFSISRINNSN